MDIGLIGLGRMAETWSRGAWAAAIASRYDRAASAVSPAVAGGAQGVGSFDAMRNAFADHAVR
jgi:6-phosphogluconate dehydrogenase (decarboxylating)